MDLSTGDDKYTSVGKKIDTTSSDTAINNSSIAPFSSVRDGVQSCIENSINLVLDQSTEYNAAEVNTWVDSITNQCLDRLRKLSEKFKYIVSVMVLQRSPAGFHLFTTCYWDQSNDGSVTHRWDNKHLHCVVVVYGVSY